MAEDTQLQTDLTSAQQQEEKTSNSTKMEADNNNNNSLKDGEAAQGSHEVDEIDEIETKVYETTTDIANDSIEESDETSSKNDSDSSAEEGEEEEDTFANKGDDETESDVEIENPSEMAREDLQAAFEKALDRKTQYKLRFRELKKSEDALNQRIWTQKVELEDQKRELDTKVNRPQPVSAKLQKAQEEYDRRADNLVFELTAIREEKRKVVAELESSKIKIKEMLEKEKKMDDEVADLKKARDDATQHCIDAENTASTHVRSIGKQNKEIERLEKLIEDKPVLHQTIQRLEEEKALLEKEKALLAEKNPSAKEFFDLRKQLEELEDDFKELMAKSKKIKSKAADDIEELKSTSIKEVEELNNLHTIQMQASNAELKHVKDNMKKTINQRVEKAHPAMVKELERLREEIDDLRHKRNELEDIVKHNEEDIEYLRNHQRPGTGPPIANLQSQPNRTPTAGIAGQSTGRGMASGGVLPDNFVVPSAAGRGSGNRGPPNRGGGAPRGHAGSGGPRRGGAGGARN